MFGSVNIFSNMFECSGSVPVYGNQMEYNKNECERELLYVWAHKKSENKIDI